MNLPEEAVQQFIATAFERHRIYILKELGVPKPWTKSTVFGSYYFCNVFRRIDKTSKWIIDNVIAPGRNNPDLWKWIILARYISRIDTLEYLKEEGGLESFMDAQLLLRKRKAAGGKIVTNAFVVNSKTTDGYADKITHLFRTIKFFQDEYPHMDELLQGATLEMVYKWLLEAPGCGPFMSYQYVCDMAYSERYLMHAPDELAWTQLGLGAMRGMNRILGNTNIKTQVPNALECVRELHYRWSQWCTPNVLIQEGYQTMDLAGDKGFLPRIEDLYGYFTRLKLCDVQHWLCEHDKYMRGGSKKRTYDGGLHAD